MLDLTVRFLAWMLDICTPNPRGRHRLGALPPLRFIPSPPPLFTDAFDSNASRFLSPYVLHPTERRRQRAAHLATPGSAALKPIHGLSAPAANR
ncbi:hypothetical protein SUDANB140_04486 [Streptomyces sp. enrichment culture]